MSNTTDSRVSHEWATRPQDQRYETVDSLYQAVKARRVDSKVHDVAIDCMKVVPMDSGELALADTHGNLGGGLTNWAFAQLCQRAKAPAGYLRTLPAQLAAIPLQWSLETHEASGAEGNDAKVLVRGDRGSKLDTITAITSTTYGRIWDADVVSAIRDNVDLSRWKVPSASYQARDPKRATTLYASDRDVFMFLVNEENAIDAGGGDVLRRGFYVWNSEVGSASFGLATFTYDYVCDNRIIWGQSDFRELRIRHTSGGPHRFVNTAVPQLAAYREAGTGDIVATVRAAKAREVGRDKKSVIEWMKARGFTTPVAAAAFQAAERDRRGYNPRSVWGLVQGLTDVAKGIAHTDDRVGVESRAGALLESVAA
jgi:hypothetical protein